MFLREYVYVDSDRVAGLAGQLYDGVPEKAINVTARQKRLDIDVKLIKGGTESGTEDQTERNLADSLFKDLEADLESLGLLRDLSDELARDEAWENIEAAVRPGQILRITSPGTLFHPEQMSNAILGLATAADGLSDLGMQPAQAPPTPTVPPKAKSDAQKRAERTGRQQPSDPRFPEDHLPASETIPFMQVPRKQLAGMIKITRGVFGEGVHLNLRPCGPEGPTISARLEPGRRFLDSSPEVMSSRNGLGEQEWTVVGVVGQLGNQITPAEVGDITNADSSVNRAAFVDLGGHFLGVAAGLVDLPRAPGFSLIPLAVHRVIGESISAEE